MFVTLFVRGKKKKKSSCESSGITYERAGRTFSKVNEGAAAVRFADCQMSGPTFILQRCRCPQKALMP